MSVSAGSDKNSSKKPYEEGVLKKHFMKNTYEENLFKAEDERFEFDITIQQFRMTIKWLEQVLELGIESEIGERLMNKVKKYSVVFFC